MVFTYLETTISLSLRLSLFQIKHTVFLQQFLMTLDLFTMIRMCPLKEGAPIQGKIMSA